MSLKLIDILNEEKERCEYQVRDIGGSVYYKKCGKGKKWLFTDEIDFLKNSKKSNTEEWEKPKDKKSKIRQLDVPQKKGDMLEYLKIYYTNLSSDNYKIEVDGDTIVIKPSPLKYQ
jgi:hypothetical protein